LFSSNNYNHVDYATFQIMRLKQYATAGWMPSKSHLRWSKTMQRRLPVTNG